MTNNLFVGGLPYETTQEELAKLFAACGKVNKVKLIMDGLSSRCKGFGFVEMSTEAEAQAAIAKLNGTAFGERQLVISEARPLEKRSGILPGKPGFVERRSGPKDRRRHPPAVAGEKRPADMSWQDGAKRDGFGGAKKWRKGPGGFGGKKKPWEKPTGDAGKRKDFGGKKKWGGKRPGAPRRDERRPS